LGILVVTALHAVLAALIGVGLVVAGVSVLAGAGWALVAAGVLVLVGAVLLYPTDGGKT
jgi:hypothetical protein